MLIKEQAYARDKLYMQRHPLLQPKMRVILLDWLMEVSVCLLLGFFLTLEAYYVLKWTCLNNSVAHGKSSDNN